MYPCEYLAYRKERLIKTMKIFNRKGLILLTLLLSAAILLASCGGENEEENNEEDTTNQENNDTEEGNNDLVSNEIELDQDEQTDVDPDEAIATVNGEEIPMADLQAQMQQVEQMFAQQGGDIEDEEVQQMLMQYQQQVLEQLISQELLVQTADDLNIQADEEKVEEAVEQELKQIRSQFEDEDQFEEILATEDLTIEEIEEDIRESYRENYKIEQLLSLNHLDEDEITVSQDDLKEYYEQVSLQNPDIGEFEDVEAEMKEQLKGQQYIQQLREEADIEILI